MHPPLPRWKRPRWLRLPRRTVRLRFTAVYGGLFLLSSAALVAITYALFERATRYTQPQLPQIPRTPAVQNLQSLLNAPAIQDLLRKPSPRGFAVPSPPAAATTLFQPQIDQVQHDLSVSFPHGGPAILSYGPLRTAVSQLASDEHQVAQAVSKQTQTQHQLSQAVSLLADAVHQVARAGSVEAAQRAADSHQLLVNAGIALAIVAVLVLLAAWLVAGRMLRPIRTITRTARRISSASLHERLALAGPQDELKELGDTLDELFGRLDAAFEAQRHFVANASHELRTPLTAERSLLQVALDDPDASAGTWRATAEELLASNDEQIRLIEALLALASSEGGLDHRQPVDIADVADTVLLDRHGTEPPGVTVDSSLESALLDGDPQLVERLVVNLVDNAMRHNVAGGRVEVSTVAAGDGRAVLRVTNTGPVVPAAEMDRLFQPFQRLDPRRLHHDDGHGVGLSIVRAVAKAHGASVTARPRPEGGVDVEVAFPPAVQPART
jgi:signal transduction histidine kinase